MSSEQKLLDLGKHIAQRVADIMNQGLSLADSDEERMVLVLIAISRMMQAGSHMIADCVEEVNDLPPAQRVLALAIIVQSALDGSVSIGLADRLAGKRMELAMRRIMERTEGYARHVRAGEG